MDGIISFINILHKMKPLTVLSLTTTLIIIFTATHQSQATSPPPPRININLTDIYETSKQLCWNCATEAMQFLYGHNAVRARKLELPLTWDSQLANYARWWALQRQGDCELLHSFPEGDFKLGENIFWGSGPSWTPLDSVSTWADEEKYYDYRSNSCAGDHVCGHYTQIVWRSTRSVGCARVVCESGDVFITCNYSPPGNLVGERPY